MTTENTNFSKEANENQVLREHPKDSPKQNPRENPRDRIQDTQEQQTLQQSLKCPGQNQSQIGIKLSENGKLPGHYTRTASA